MLIGGSLIKDRTTKPFSRKIRFRSKKKTNKFDKLDININFNPNTGGKVCFYHVKINNANYFNDTKIESRMRENHHMFYKQKTPESIYCKVCSRMEDVMLNHVT